MGSKARAEGNCNYRLWTTEELIEGYAWEFGRKNQDDAKHTQRLIKVELTRRFNAVLDMLDDEQTIKNPQETFRYLKGE